MRIDLETELSRLHPTHRSDSLTRESLRTEAAARRRATRVRATVWSTVAALVLGLGAWSWTRSAFPPPAPTHTSPSASAMSTWPPGKYHPADFVPRSEVLSRCHASEPELMSGDTQFMAGQLLNLTNGRTCWIGYDFAPRRVPVERFETDLVQQCSDQGGYDFTGWDAFTDFRSDHDVRTIVLVSSDQWFATCTVMLGAPMAALSFTSLWQNRLSGAVPLQMDLNIYSGDEGERLLQLEFKGAAPVWAPDRRLSDRARRIVVADEHGHTFDAPVINGFAFPRARFDYSTGDPLPATVPPLHITVLDAQGHSLFVADV